MLVIQLTVALVLVMPEEVMLESTGGAAAAKVVAEAAPDWAEVPAELLAETVYV
jgi:hypothetical protein